MTREQLELENAKLRRVVRAAVHLRDAEARHKEVPHFVNSYAEAAAAVNEALADFNWELGGVCRAQGSEESQK